MVSTSIAISQVLRETDLLPWPRWQTMVPAENGWWRLPDEAPRIPLMYAVRARGAA